MGTSPESQEAQGFQHPAPFPNASLAGSRLFPHDGLVAKGDELQRVGRAVAARRGELGMTQQELADRAHVDLKTVYNLESGTRWPRVTTRAAIAAGLGWEADALAQIAAAPAPRELHREQFSADDLDDESFAPEELEAIQDYTDDLKRRLARARRKYPGQPLTGAMVFPRSLLYQQVWDLLTSLGWQPDGIPKSMAAMLVWRDSHSGDVSGSHAAGLRLATVT